MKYDGTDTSLGGVSHLLSDAIREVGSQKAKHVKKGLYGEGTAECELRGSMKGQVSEIVDNMLKRTSCHCAARYPIHLERVPSIRNRHLTVIGRKRFRDRKRRLGRGYEGVYPVGDSSSS